jgi:hypothetical protein
MPIDLRNSRVRDCVDSILMSEAETLKPEQLQATEVISEMWGRPMTASQKRSAREARQFWILLGEKLA